METINQNLNNIALDIPNPLAESRLADFLQRVFAFLIDAVIISTVGLLITFLFKDLFLNLGDNLWYIGFIIWGVYLVLFNSNLGKGQTLGKKLLKIRIIGEKGRFLTIEQSFLRYCILGLMFFSPSIGRFLYSFGGYFQTIAMIFNIIGFVIFLWIVVLLIFNKDKRGFHDYLAKTIVIKSKNINDINLSKSESLREVFNSHKNIFLILSILSILFLVLGMSFKTTTPANLNLNNDLVRNLGMQDDTTLSASGVKTRNLIFLFYLDYSIYNDQSKKSQLHDQINKSLSTYPEIKKYDNIIIKFRTGYDIGIASFYMIEEKRNDENSTNIGSEINLFFDTIHYSSI